MENEALHTHNFKKSIVPPTCKSTGYTLYTCECGYEHKTDFQPSGAHNFVIAETIPATCTEPGRAKMVCTTCGETCYQTLAPIGHAYGEWAVQTYPTCAEAGRRICKCERCDAIMEENIPPRGHKCVPGTERRVDGKVVDYFCGNCGQTIAGAPLIEPTSNVRTGGAGIAVARIALILASVSIFLSFIFMVIQAVFVDDIVPLSFPLSCISVIINAVWYLILAVKADKLKRNPCYTRWMSIEMLKIVVFNVVFAILTFHDYAKHFPISTVLRIIASSYWITLIYLLFAIVFLSGTKKKIWVLIVALVFASFAIIGSIINLFNLVDFVEGMDSVDGFIYIIRNVASYFATVFNWTGMAILIAPAKKQRKLQ